MTCLCSERTYVLCVRETSLFTRSVTGSLTAVDLSQRKEKSLETFIEFFFSHYNTHVLHFQLYTILLNYFRYLRSFVVCTDFRGRTQRRQARSCGHIRSPAAIPQHFKVLYIFCTLYTNKCLFSEE